MHAEPFYIIPYGMYGIIVSLELKGAKLPLSKVAV